MQNDNIYKKLRFFALCLAIICMLLSLIKRAKAEGIPTEVKNEFMQYYCVNFTDNQILEVSNLIDNSKYYCYVKDFRGTTIYPCLILWNIDDIEFGCNNTNNFLNYIQFTTGELGVQTRYSISNFDIYLLKIDNYKGTTATKFTFTNNVNKGNSYYIHYSPSRSAIFNDINQTGSNVASSNTAPTSTNAGNRTDVKFIYTDEFRLYKRSGSSYQNQGFNESITYFSNIENVIPVTSNTAGFECYKLETKGGIYLYADFSNLISISNAVGNSSTFSCDIHLDDNIQNISLNSNSEYYQYSVEYSEAYYSFPITAFIPNYAEYDNVWIDNVKVINTTTSAGGSATNTFVYITSIDILGNSYNNGNLVNPNDVIIPNGEYEPPTNIEITENTYLVEFSNKDGLSFSEFHNTDIPNIYESNTTWVYMDKQTYTFREFIEDFLGLNFPPKLVEYITGVNNEEDAVDQMTNYLYNNAFTLTSDMVIFVYIDGDWKAGDFTSDDLTYWIYYTASGRLRAISQLMNSTNTNISRQLALSSSYYQYTKTKINTIDKNLYEFANNQLGFNNTFISKLNNIDTLLSRIESILNKILDALKNLHINQLDTIDTKLSTIISNIGNSNSLNEDDTVAEAIQYYKSHNNNGVPTAQVYTDDKMSIWISGKVHLWLQGTDANTDKTNLINSVFDTLTSIYDSMKNNNDIFPNIQYFLDAIAKNNNYGYDTHGDYMTRLFKGNVDISTYNGISE